VAVSVYAVNVRSSAAAMSLFGSGQHDAEDAQRQHSPASSVFGPLEARSALIDVLNAFQSPENRFDFFQ